MENTYEKEFLIISALKSGKGRFSARAGLMSAKTTTVMTCVFGADQFRAYPAGRKEIGSKTAWKLSTAVLPAGDGGQKEDRSDLIEFIVFYATLSNLGIT